MLFVNACLSKQSLGVAIAKKIGRKWKNEINLWDKSLPAFDADCVSSNFRIMNGNGSQQDYIRMQEIEKWSLQVRDAESILIASPVWNSGLPYVVKQYIDIVVQPGITLHTEDTTNEATIPEEAKNQKENTKNQKENTKYLKGDTKYQKGDTKTIVLVTVAGGQVKASLVSDTIKDIFKRMGFGNMVHIHIENAAREERKVVLEKAMQQMECIF